MSPGVVWDPPGSANPRYGCDLPAKVQSDGSTIAVDSLGRGMIRNDPRRFGSIPAGPASCGRPMIGSPDVVVDPSSHNTGYEIGVSSEALIRLPCAAPGQGQWGDTSNGQAAVRMDFESGQYLAAPATNPVALRARIRRCRVARRGALHHRGGG